MAVVLQENVVFNLLAEVTLWPLPFQHLKVQYARPTMWEIAHKTKKPKGVIALLSLLPRCALRAFIAEPKGSEARRPAIYAQRAAISCPKGARRGSRCRQLALPIVPIAQFIPKGPLRGKRNKRLLPLWSIGHSASLSESKGHFFV